MISTETGNKFHVAVKTENQTTMLLINNKVRCPVEANVSPVLFKTW